MDEANPPQTTASTRDVIAELLDHLRQDNTLAKLLASAARPNATNTQPSSLSGDILYGADAIAEFLYGDCKHRRKVYNLIETGRLPHFRLGAGICSRKSVLHEWIVKQEQKQRANTNGG